MKISIGKIKKSVFLLIFIFFLAFLWSANFKALAFERRVITDWYIKNFDTEIVLNKDSSAEIIEKITADCGDLPGKHGIFRIVPEKIKIKDGKEIKTPVKLISITDFSGKPYKYKTIYRNGTITWKIGDPHKTVQGVNNYLIHYKVGNVIRFDNPSFDEFYWNLLGAFWDLEIDNFSAKIIFPKEISKENVKIEYYTGYLGEKRKDLAHYFWSASNVLEFNSTQPLKKRQGITVSITFPKGIFSPYHFSFWEIYGDYFRKYFYFLIPLLVFIVCFYLWWKYGKDPYIKKSIVPLYRPPENLTPLEIGVLTTGREAIKSEFITAEIINLAVKGLITIKEIEKEKFLIFHSKDYQLIRNHRPEIEKNLTLTQKFILEKIFEKGDKINLSSLKNKFYKNIKTIQKKTRNSLIEKQLITKKGISLSKRLWVLGFVLLFVLLLLFSFLDRWIPFSPIALVSLGLSLGIIFIFSCIMPSRTLKGAETLWKIKGFKMFMETVDKDRAKFYEKENIFEKLLPYAIVFGITDLWIKRIKQIYGEEYFTRYAPCWYVSTSRSFDTKSFSSNLNALTSAIATNVGSRSGAGGTGGVGGGAGGGGGGGW